MASKGAVGTGETERPTAAEIFDGVLVSARDELDRSWYALALSGLAAGLGMGLTGIGVAAAQVTLAEGPETSFVALLLYPIGFVVVIVGRQQLFTENTLYPVALALDEKGHWLATLRLWTVVFVANTVGAVLFALLSMESGGLGPEVTAELARLGAEVEEGALVNTFWSAVLAGWLIALVAWLVTAAQGTLGQIAVIYLLTFVVGLAGLDHVIASATEILSGVFGGTVAVGDFLGWLAATFAGNVAGGVVIVTILNYGQVVAGNAEKS